MEKEWKKIPGYENEVTAEGDVRSVPHKVMRKNGSPHSVKGKLLSPWKSSSGHLLVRVHLTLGGSNDRGVHCLVLEAFVGPCPKGMECRHLNDIPDDNRLENLVWGTRKEQAEDRKKNGNSHYSASAKGESQWTAKMTGEKVKEVRERSKTRRGSYNQLAAEFGVSKACIRNIIKRVTWKHID